jgi:hypothetical protein
MPEQDRQDYLDERDRFREDPEPDVEDDYDEEWDWRYDYDRLCTPHGDEW